MKLKSVSSSCGHAGGCVGGPSFEKYHNTPVRNYKAVSAYAGDEHADVGSPELTAITRNSEIMQGMKVVLMSIRFAEIMMMQMGKSKREMKQLWYVRI